MKGRSQIREETRPRKPQPWTASLACGPAHIKKWAGTPSPGIPACPVRDPLHPLTGGAPEIRRALPAVALASAATATAAAAAEAPPAAAAA